MMYEALLFDMNALGDIPDKDFTSRAVHAGSSPHGGRRAEAEKPESPSGWAPEDLEAGTSRFQGGRDLIALAFKLSDPVSPSLPSSCVDRGSQMHSVSTFQNHLGTQLKRPGSGSPPPRPAETEALE